MKLYDKEKIDLLSKEVNLTNISNVYNMIDEFMLDIINIVAKTAPISSKEYEFFAVNELTSGAITVTSDIDYILAITAPQIEINTLKLEKKFYKVIFDKVKFAWANRKSKIKKRRKLKQIETPKFESRYNAESLRKDLFNQLRYYFTDKTTLLNLNNRISILSKDELGYNINIYICLKGENNQYKLYDSAKNKFIHIDFHNRYNNIDTKCIETSERMIDLMRVYNSLYYNIMQYNANQLLIESIMYNIPNSIYEETNNYLLFIKSINFLSLVNFDTFQSICDLDKLMVEDDLITKELSSFKTFISELKKQL